MSNNCFDRRNAPLEELNPELFLYELYDAYGLYELGRFGGVERYAIGYCDAGRLRVRPKSDEIALMCEMDDGEKMWFHILKDHLEMLVERRNWRIEHESMGKNP